MDRILRKAALFILFFGYNYKGFLKPKVTQSVISMYNKKHLIVTTCWKDGKITHYWLDNVYNVGKRSKNRLNYASRILRDFSK